MKRKFIIVVFLLGALAACTPDWGDISRPDGPASGTGITGTWKWFESRGFGLHHTPQSTNQSLTLTLRNDSTFVRNGDYYLLVPNAFPDTSGTFRLDTVFNNIAGCYPVGTVPFVEFISTGPPARDIFFECRIRSNDTLVLDGGSGCDFPVFYFVRN